VGWFQPEVADRLAMGFGHHDRRGRSSVPNVSLFGAVPVGIVGDAGRGVRTPQWRST
jgi:hypothetical protein